MADTNNFKIDTSNFLGISYNSYCDDVYALALSKPSDYFQMRKNVLKVVKEQAIGDLYKSFYNILSKGLDKNDKEIKGAPSMEGANGAGNFQPPGYPSQRVNEIALSSAATLNKLLDEVIEIILPIDYNQIANKRVQEKSKANIE